MTFGSLFAGIGGMDIGLERAGLECRWQVEIDEFCQRVLERHWPNVRREKDVRSVPTDGEWEVDVIAGGFPCQGISAANYLGKGLEDARSGLWTEFARVLRVLRPRYAIIENVRAITFRGLGTVLGDLAGIGFDAEWQIIPASGFGAPHRRDRVFIVAYPAGERCQADEVFCGGTLETASEKQAARLRFWPGERQCSVALPDRFRWCPDSELCRVVDGVPDRLDRYRVLGNSIVPQVAEWIGRRLIAAESLTKEQ